MRAYEVTPARTGTSLPIWKYQLCAVFAVTVRVYSKSFCSPSKSPPGAVTFKSAHLLSEVRSNKVQILCYCASEGLSGILSHGTLLEYFFFLVLLGTYARKYLYFTVDFLHWEQHPCYFCDVDVIEDV